MAATRINSVAEAEAYGALVSALSPIQEIAGRVASVQATGEGTNARIQQLEAAAGKISEDVDEQRGLVEDTQTLLIKGCTVGDKTATAMIQLIRAIKASLTTQREVAIEEIQQEKTDGVSGTHFYR